MSDLAYSPDDERPGDWRDPRSPHYVPYDDPEEKAAVDSAIAKGLIPPRWRR